MELRIASGSGSDCHQVRPRQIIGSDRPYGSGRRNRAGRSRVTESWQDPEVLGGREAEHFLHTLVASHANFHGASLYPNKRVPAGYRRREIDLIVVTPKRVHIIEVKNWSGMLRMGGNGWVQTNCNGREIQHPDLVADHLDKSAALVAYLAREGITLEPSARAKFLSNKVIFMNPRLMVLSREIAHHPDILLPHRLADYLGLQQRAGLGERLLGSIIQWCLDTDGAAVVMDGYFGSMTAERVAAVRVAVDRLGTWDTLRYYGQRVEVGDLIHLSVGGRTILRLIVLLGGVFAVGCSGTGQPTTATGLDARGQRLAVGKAELFFTAGVDEGEARKVGEVFVREKFFEDRPAVRVAAGRLVILIEEGASAAVVASMADRVCGGCHSSNAHPAIPRRQA